MATLTRDPPLTIAGISIARWAFGIRIWLAVVTALAAAFWLDLEVPSTAAITVAILAEPTRGHALEKAAFRVIATIIGITASIVIVALFSQARDLALVAFAGWLGLCVYAAGLLDGYRAYGAVLAGYTVAIIAIQQFDTPDRVFEVAMARGAAIAVGIAAIAVVNDVLAAPDHHPQLGARLAALHKRVRDYANAVVRAATTAPEAITLLADIAALRPEITSLAAESADGPTRAAAARTTAVALVAQVHAARVRNAAAVDRRDAEVDDALAALRAGRQPRRIWRAPFYRSHRTAVASGIRAALWLGLGSVFFVLAGWPSADIALAVVAVIIGLGAVTPIPQLFTVVALVGAVIAGVLAGILAFVVLDGATDFPLLALALAPFVIGAAVAKTSSHRLVSALGRFNLIFVLVLFAPSNPQSWDPATFLVSVLFVAVAAALLLAAQLLIPPVAGARRQRWLVAAARRELDRLVSGCDRRLAPEEAMFRDAVRIGQIAGAAGAAPEQRAAALRDALTIFDRAASIRLGAAPRTEEKPA